jgi:hypothetical protein
VQSPVRTNDLLNAVRYVTSPQDSTALAQAFPGLQIIDTSASSTATESSQPAGDANAADANGLAASGPRAGFLAGDEYYAAKDQLIIDEQLLLRLLRFEVGVQHAHKYLLNMCHVLGCSQPLAQMATCLVRLKFAHTYSGITGIVDMAACCTSSRSGWQTASRLSKCSNI